MLKKVNNGYEVDDEFINMLADFGLDELMLPFETRNKEIMTKYATGKYDPEEMDPIGILKSLKKAGIRIRSNFLIGFRVGSTLPYQHVSHGTLQFFFLPS